MEWRDEGIILSSRKYGEYDAILDVLTRGHGRHSGIVKGGFGRRQRGNIQPGNEVAITWRGRLETPLGPYSVELKERGLFRFFIAQRSSQHLTVVAVYLAWLCLKMKLTRFY